VHFDERAAAAYGAVRTSLASRGKPLGAYDMMIAAQALSLGLILVTANERELKAVKSLAVENWRR
jgi:tRNA(fMet)-specific endonuclease VapC